MKHTVKSKQKIDNHNSIVTVLLIPDNDIEKIAINNLQNLNATQKERDIVENYLHFSLQLGDYSIVELLNQKGNLFVLKILI